MLSLTTVLHLSPVRGVLHWSPAPGCIGPSPDGTSTRTGARGGIGGGSDDSTVCPTSFATSIRQYVCLFLRRHYYYYFGTISHLRRLPALRHLHSSVVWRTLRGAHTCWFGACDSDVMTNSHLFVFSFGQVHRAPRRRDRVRDGIPQRRRVSRGHG